MSNVLRLFVVVALSYRSVLANPVLHAGANCFLGSGFDFQAGCQKSSATSSNLKKCNDKHNHADPGPCIESQDSSSEIAYTTDVRSQQSYNALLSTAISGEGSAMGNTLSASVSYLTKSQTTENSVAFFLGQSGTVRVDLIRGTQSLKLTHSAKKLLKRCKVGKCDFITTYGLHYVYSITYGRSFLGGFNLWDKSSSKSSDLHAMAKFSSDKLFFVPAASAEFKRKVDHSSSKITKTADAKWTGGEGISLDSSSPESLYKTFLKWQDSSKDHPVAITMEYRNWIDLPEVQEIVNKKGQAIIKLFNTHTITQAVTDRITAEMGQTNYAINAVLHAKEWGCAQQKLEFKNKLVELERNGTTHLSQLQGFDEGKLAERQTEIQSGNFSWFIADKLVDDYRAIVEKYLPGGFCGDCEVQNRCDSWCCDNSDYGTCCSQAGSMDGKCARTGDQCCGPDFSCPPGKNCYPHEKVCCGEGKIGCASTEVGSSGVCCDKHWSVCCSSQGYDGCCSTAYPVCGAKVCCRPGYKPCGKHGKHSCCKGKGSELEVEEAAPKGIGHAGHAGNPHIFMFNKSSTASIANTANTVLFF